MLLLSLGLIIVPDWPRVTISTCALGFHVLSAPNYINLESSAGRLAHGYSLLLCVGWLPLCFIAILDINLVRSTMSLFISKMNVHFKADCSVFGSAVSFINSISWMVFMVFVALYIGTLSCFPEHR